MKKMREDYQGDSYSFVIKINEVSFNLSICTTQEKMSITANKKTKSKSSLKTYKNTFTIGSLIDINRVFIEFFSFDEIAKEIKNSLDKNKFKVELKEEKIIMTVNILGIDTSLPLPLFNGNKNNDQKTKMSTMLVNTTLYYRQKIEKISQELKEENQKHQKLEEELIKLQKEHISLSTMIKTSNLGLSKEKHIRFNPSLFKIKRIINQHEDCVTSICFTKDERLASCSGDETIKIFNLETYEEELSIKEHNEEITYICVLEDGCLVSSSKDYTIKIWRVFKDYYQHEKTLVEHTNFVYKAIPITQGRLCSCSKDETIKIWMGTPPYNCIKTLDEQSGLIISVIEAKNKDLLLSLSDCENKTICFWKASSYKFIKMIAGVGSCSNNSVIQIDDDRILVGEEDRISIININSLVLENSIKEEGIRFYSSFLQLEDDTVLCGCINKNNTGSLVCIDVDEAKILKIKSDLHSSTINEILSLGDDILISCSDDNSISFWKY